MTSIHQPSRSRFNLGLFTAMGLLGLSIIPSWAEDNWPMWLRDTRGAAQPDDPVITDPAAGKIMWQSEVMIPPGRTKDSRRAATNTENPHSGGFASPIVADGVVYQFHYRPSGTVYDKMVVDKRLKTTQEALREQSKPIENNHIYGHDRWLIGATDILTAVDASSGKLLWQKDLGDGGLNWNMFSKGGPLNTPAYADGRVFVVGTVGDVYAVDAKSGELLWQSDIGWRAEQNRRYRAGAEALEHMAPRFSRDFLSSVTVADDVVLVSDQRRHNVIITGKREYHYEPKSGYVAFDAKTGKRLWGEDDIGGDTTPALWQHQGKEYLLASGIFTLSLREPRSGKVIWKTDFGHDSSYRPTLSEDYAVIQHRVKSSRDTHITGYRISPKGMQQLWQWPKDRKTLGNLLISNGYGYVMLNIDENNLICFDLETGKTIKAVTAPRLGGEQDNAMLLAYGPWLVTANGKYTKGFNFFPLDPEIMDQGPRFLPCEHATGYHIAMMPAFAKGFMFVRTEERLAAYRFPLRK